MCGIAGILNLQPGPPPDEALLRGMLGMIRHRGPDEFGIYLNEQVGLGSARLSIIDLAGGQQPISNEDDTLWIVFNGEIFNYPELKTDLVARGHCFKTDTDTEVILHLYEEHGPACLQRLNGQFAIALWDERERALLLARDRLGVRPVFYTRAVGKLVFGSEIKALLANREVRAEIDPVSLDQVFTYWSTLASRTIFRGIGELPPGHYLLARGAKVEVRRYYSLDFGEQAGGMAGGNDGRAAREEELAEEFHQLLRDATRIRLRADVPVGAYLSGGLDSSTIAALVRNLGVSRLDTFSIAFSDPVFDESEFQRRMAKFLGTDHQVVHASHDDIAEVFPEVIWHTEIPIMRTSPAPMFLLSRLVRRRGYKVVLTGEGADEFLGGYDIFKEMKVRRFWASSPASKWRPALLQRLYPDIQGLRSANSSFLNAFFATGLEETDAPDYSHAIRWRNNRRNCRFFSEAVASAAAEQGGGAAPGIDYPAGFNSWGPLEKAQYLEISIFMSQYLLSSQGDRVAMGNSVEGRYPFLDPRVVQFCTRLPARLKLRGLTEKVLLRQVARRYLPEEISARPKRPYRAPIHRSFLNSSTQPYVREMLSAPNLRTAGLFKPEAVAHLVAKLEQGRAGESDDMALVGILSAQLLHHQFVANFRPAAPLVGGDKVKVIDRATSPGRDAVPASQIESPQG